MKNRFKFHTVSDKNLTRGKAGYEANIDPLPLFGVFPVGVSKVCESGRGSSRVYCILKKVTLHN